MRLADLWSKCAETAAATLLQAEQELARLKNIGASETEIAKASAIAKEAGLLHALSVRNYLAEI